LTEREVQKCGKKIIRIVQCCGFAATRILRN